MDHMMKELTQYHQEEMKKTYGRVKENSNEPHL